MRIAFIRILAVISAILGSAISTSAAPPRAIPFQATLKTAGGVPVTRASQAINLRLYTTVTGGAAVYAEAQTVSVSGGLLATTIGNGNPNGFSTVPFNVPYFVGVTVGADPEMTPRVPLSAVPYANYAAGVAPESLNSVSWLLGGNSGTDPATQFIGTTDNQPVVVKSYGRQTMRYAYAENTAAQYRSVNILGGSEINTISAAIGATIAGGGLDLFTGTDYPNSVTGEFGTVGGGYNNTSSTTATVAGGSSNSANGESSTVAGGSSNSANGYSSTVAGGISNSANGYRSTISGGDTNVAAGTNTFIGGGQANNTPQQFTTVAGGRRNNAQGDYSFIGGGRDNTTGTYESVVAGGRANQATGGDAAIGGGYANLASGGGSAIPGGVFNAATGAYSFAAGYRAKSNHGGTFVWGDNTEADFASTGVNQFLVRASGGVGIGTAFPAYALDVQGDINARGNVRANGVVLSSDSRYKTHVQTFDNALDAVMNLRGVTFDWNLKAWPGHGFPAGPQVGFIAQEVEKVLPELVSTDNQGYKSVAYANVIPITVEAIKALQKEIQDKDARIVILESKAGRVDELEARLKRLEQRLDAGQGRIR